MTKFYRDHEERLVGGVASGFGVATGTETILVRAAFVLLSLIGGAGLVLYGAAWLLTPEAAGAEEEPPIPPLIRRDPVAAIGVVFITLGAVALLRAAVPWIARCPVWPLALVGLGVLLMLRRR